MREIVGKLQCPSTEKKYRKNNESVNEKLLFQLDFPCVRTA